MWTTPAQMSQTCSHRASAECDRRPSAVSPVVPERRGHGFAGGRPSAPEFPALPPSVRPAITLNALQALLDPRGSRVRLVHRGHSPFPFILNLSPSLGSGGETGDTGEPGLRWVLGSTTESGGPEGPHSGSEGGSDDATEGGGVGPQPLVPVHRP